MTFDPARLARRLKPAKRLAQLRRRAASELAVGDEETFPRGSRLVFDTTVYVDTAAGRFPPALERMVESGLVHHSAVCIGELCFGLGMLDPRHPETPKSMGTIDSLLADLAGSRRIVVPDENDWAAGAMLAGILARTQNYAAGHRRRAVLDAVLFASALSRGLVVLTANLAEFDLLQQLVPKARIAFYRRAA